ncbi:hypothetical protein AgCh_006140 [Apium graveolens]
MLCSSTFEKSWTNLPSELLSKIADDFEIVDLLRFRAVCKDWRSASFPCSAQTESTGLPWLLASPTEGGSNNYILYNQSKDKKYLINIPELEGAYCLASDLGWLLLSRGNQLFFFCPFTRAKIELPEFPQADLADHVAAFTCFPTSQECVVTVFDRFNDNEVEVHMIQHGNNTWNRYVHVCNRSRFNQLTGATYCNEEEVFYYLDKNNQVLTFSPKELRFKKYSIVDCGSDSSVAMMPFRIYNAYLAQIDRKLLDINENASISSCGTMIRCTDGCETLIQNENMKGTSDKSHKAIWIHPRFQQIPPGPGWSV